MFEQLNGTQRDKDVISMEALAHIGFGEWVKSHVDEVISELPYDPNNHNQWINRVILEPRPSLKTARFWGESAMGADNYETLLAQLDNHNVVDTVLKNSLQKVSTLIATLHLQNTFDTALTHNALFVAAGNEDFADKNIILANFIMSRMRIGGLAVDNILTYSGWEIRDPPPAVENYVAADTIRYIRRLATPALKQALVEGVAIHRAPSGTRAKAILLEDGSLGKMVPIVNASTVKTIRKRSPIAVGIPMDVKFGYSVAHVFEPRQIGKDDDVHRLMEDMVEASNELTDGPVYYGLPPGARLLNSKSSI